jgi:uncharacterized protein with FMN-binding domain
MRRAILTIGSTAAGLAALLSFKTHSSAAADSAVAATTPTTIASPTIAAPTARSHKTGASSKMTSPKTGSPTAASSGMSTTVRTITGSVETTRYGPMQVKVTLAGQRITNVTVLQQTDDGSLSQSIDSNAIPKLTSETLTAQSARIDAVSGATVTSSGYIQSLQSALDQA